MSYTTQYLVFPKYIDAAKISEIPLNQDKNNVTVPS